MTASRAGQRYVTILLAVFSIAYCAWILSLPVFPTQDGPVHLYYVRIMQALLLHRDPGIFPQYFTIKHLLPPYALYYYLLLGLGQVVSLPMADKLVICLYVPLFLFGARFLMRGLGRSGEAMSLLAGPLVLNWALCMGFVNFCLSTALSLWALGLWCRVAQEPESRRTAWRLAGFCALCYVVMLTHPVPLLWVLGFCGTELAVRIGRARRRGQPLTAQLLFNWTLLRDGGALLVASLTLLYVRAFTSGHVVQQTDIANQGYLSAVGNFAPMIMLLNSLDPFSFGSLPGFVRRLPLFLIMIFALRRGWRDMRASLQAHTWTVANTWFAVSAALALALPVMPPELNGSSLFSARLVLLAWLGALAGASGVSFSGLPIWKTRLSAEGRGVAMIAVCSMVLVGLSLLMGILRINPMASEIGRLETMPAGETGRVSLALASEDYAGPRDRVTFDPYWWSAARLARRSDSVLYDSPWLELAIIPIGTLPTMPNGKVEVQDFNIPALMRRDMETSAEARRALLTPVNGAIVNFGVAKPEGGVDPLLALDPAASHRWSCQVEGFVSVCDARR